jgi:hypothetical protein
MENRILLVVRDEKRKSVYKKFFDEFNISWNEAESLHDAINLAAKDPHNGILIDMPLMIKTSPAIKTGIDDLLGSLPCATLNFSTASHGLRMFPRGDHAGGCSSIAQFVAVCAKYSPRIVFSKKRVPIHYNVLLNTNPGHEKSERTVCIDVSLGGCFLFSVREDIAINSTVFFNITGLDHEKPIEGVVRWVSTWGSSNKIPGIGIEFKKIPECLYEEIFKALADSS